MEQAERTMELFPHLGPDGLAAAYLRKGMYEKVIDILASEVAGQREVLAQGRIAQAYARLGDSSKARAILDDLMQRSQGTYVSPMWIAPVYAALDEKEQAFQWLEKAYEDRDDLLFTINYWSKSLDTLRSDPRFTDLLSRMGLEP